MINLWINKTAIILYDNHVSDFWKMISTVSVLHEKISGSVQMKEFIYRISNTYSASLGS